MKLIRIKNMFYASMFTNENTQYNKLSLQIRETTDQRRRCFIWNEQTSLWSILSSHFDVSKLNDMHLCGLAQIVSLYDFFLVVTFFTRSEKEITLEARKSPMI